MSTIAVARVLRSVAVGALVVGVVACGSDDATTDPPAAVESAPVQSTVTDDDDQASADAGASDEGTSDDAAADDAAADDAAQESPTGSGGTATLTLANGETLEFASVLCALEPQTAAGSEILFTATSYEDPGLDITQFGDDGTITGVASISVYNGAYDTLWEANSMFGTPVELALDGTTITGTGSFLEAGDPSNPPVEGEIIANC